MNPYVLLADVIALFHAAYIAFVVGGFGLIVVGAVKRWQWIRVLWFRLAHLGAIAFVCIDQILGRACPLTSLESRLRAAAGETKYSRDFVGYWLGRLIFYDFPPQIFLIAYIGFGILIAVALVVIPPRLPGRAKPHS